LIDEDNPPQELRSGRITSLALYAVAYYLAIVPNTDDSIATPLRNIIRVPDYIVATGQLIHRRDREARARAALIAARRRVHRVYETPASDQRVAG
jgi:hypothetical protein